MDDLKARLRATWMAGDFGQIARTYSGGAREFVDRLALQPGQRVLDVACGTGNLSIPAAEAGADVTGVDIAANLLEQARANSGGLPIAFLEGDAEALPFEPSSFDAVISMFGAMFAPRPDLVSQELLRVCRPGGRIAMANWTPGGFVGRMFKIVGKHVPPPAGMPSPLLWGDPERVQERLGSADLKMTPRRIEFRFPGLGPAAVVEFFRQYYGPTQKAFQALTDTSAQEALFAELESLWSENNRGGQDTTVVESEYLEVLAVR